MLCNIEIREILLQNRPCYISYQESNTEAEPVFVSFNVKVADLEGEWRTESRLKRLWGIGSKLAGGQAGLQRSKLIQGFQKKSKWLILLKRVRKEIRHLLGSRQGLWDKRRSGLLGAQGMGTWEKITHWELWAAKPSTTVADWTICRWPCGKPESGLTL